MFSSMNALSSNYHRVSSRNLKLITSSSWNLVTLVLLFIISISSCLTFSSSLTSLTCFFRVTINVLFIFLILSTKLLLPPQAFHRLQRYFLSSPETLLVLHFLSIIYYSTCIYLYFTSTFKFFVFTFRFSSLKSVYQLLKMQGILIESFLKEV